MHATVAKLSPQWETIGSCLEAMTPAGQSVRGPLRDNDGSDRSAACLELVQHGFQTPEQVVVGHDVGDVFVVAPGDLEVS